jgi:hypothetical protein
LRVSGGVIALKASRSDLGHRKETTAHQAGAAWLQVVDGSANLADAALL